MGCDGEGLSGARASLAKCLDILGAAIQLNLEDIGPLSGLVPGSAPASFYLLTADQINALSADLDGLDHQIASHLSQKSKIELVPEVVDEVPEIAIKSEFVEPTSGPSPTKRPRKEDAETAEETASIFNDEETMNRLKSLIKDLCLLNSDPKPLEEYLNGLPSSNFGLKYNKKVNKVCGELVLLLMECPNFNQRLKAVTFFAKLFDVWEDRMRVYLQKLYQFFSKGADKKSARRCEVPYHQITREIIENGFGRFNPFIAEKSPTFSDVPTSFTSLNDLLAVKPSSMFGKPLPNFLKQTKNRKRSHSGWEAFSSAKVDLETLPILNVKMESTAAITTYVFQYYYKTMMPTFVSKKAFGMVAVCRGEDVKSHPAVWLSRLRSVPGSDLELDFESLHKTMRNSLGISDHDIFKNTYSASCQNGYQLHQPQKVWTDLESLGHLELRKKVKTIEREIQEAAMALPRNSIADFESGEEMTISIVDPDFFDFSTVNCVVILMSGDDGVISGQPILNDDVMKQIQDGGCGKADSNKNKKIPLGLVDIFSSFYGFPVGEIPNFVESYKRKHFELRNRYSLVSCCRRILSKTSVICQHCGKEFSNHTAKLRTTAQRHILRCNLERSNCECGGLSFKNAKEKRRHMLLNHSAKKYYGCSDCLDVFTSQGSVESHFIQMHGLPGQGETCDLCKKTFQSYNNLRIHRLNHESYLCTLCENVEIIGRTPFKNHQKNFHGYGVNCEFCGKWHATQFRLEYHIKEHHEDRSYLNN